MCEVALAKRVRPASQIRPQEDAQMALSGA